MSIYTIELHVNEVIKYIIKRTALMRYSRDGQFETMLVFFFWNIGIFCMSFRYVHYILSIFKDHCNISRV